MDEEELLELITQHNLKLEKLLAEYRKYEIIATVVWLVLVIIIVGIALGIVFYLL